MSKVRVVRSSYNENLQKESYLFLKRLIDKALLDELNLNPIQKGLLLESTDKKEEFKHFGN